MEGEVEVVGALVGEEVTEDDCLFEYPERINVQSEFLRWITQNRFISSNLLFLEDQ